jgi:hypothetical protein
MNPVSRVSLVSASAALMVAACMVFAGFSAVPAIAAGVTVGAAHLFVSLYATGQ